MAIALAIADFALACIDGLQFIFSGRIMLLIVYACFLLATYRFWLRGPSAKIARFLSPIASVCALVLQALPISAVMIFKGPTYYNRDLYSCFDPMLWGYANFSPLLSALLNITTLVLLILINFGKRDDLRNYAFGCALISGALMLIPPLVFDFEYATHAAILSAVLLLAASAFQSRANSATK